jgi:hypothetical protein
MIEREGKVERNREVDKKQYGNVIVGQSEVNSCRNMENNLEAPLAAPFARSCCNAGL